MSEEENNKEVLEEKLRKVKDMIYENLKRWGHFDIMLNDGSFVVGLDFTVDYCCEEPQLLIRTSLYEIYAIIPVKSIMFIGPGIPVDSKNGSSDKE